LGEHDTCPHCRHGISKHDAQNSGQGGNNNNRRSGGATPSRNMPGAFGEGTSGNPFVFPDSPSSAQRNQGPSEGGERPQSADDNSGGGIGERIRRGLFGSPR
jgi:fission 1 protein/division protein 1